MHRGDLTIILASSAGGVARKYTVSKKLIAAAGTALAVIAVSFILSCLHYFQMWNKSVVQQGLVAELDQLRNENEFFRVDARQLTFQMALLETTAKKLEIMAGFVQEGTAGVGGPARNMRPLLDLGSAPSLKKHFKSLGRKRINMQTEFAKLQEYYTGRQILLSATPTIMPALGYLSDGYGYRRDPFTGRRDWHPGVDISAPKGARVVATADGTVSRSGWTQGYGKLVDLEHRFGIQTRYGHLSEITVKAGQKVKRGDVIGYVGSTGRATGTHVHFEVRLNHEALDPMRFLRD